MRGDEVISARKERIRSRQGYLLFGKSGGGGGGVGGLSRQITSLAVTKKFHPWERLKLQLSFAVPGASDSILGLLCFVF